MKKIAIIAEAFGGSTTSLIESFLKNGYQIDFYHIARRNNPIGSYETFDYTCTSKIGELKQIESFDFKGLHRFADFANKGLFSMYHIIGLGIKTRGIKQIFNPISKLFCKKLVNQIISKNYDFINVIGQSWTTVYISKQLHDKGMNIAHSLHEVCSNHLDGNKLDPVCIFLIKEGIKINVFSKKSANDLIKLSPKKDLQYSIIPFSLFTGYLEYKDIVIPELFGVEDYILFYGFLKEYKGLDVLYKASQHLNKKIVIAGGGYVHVLDDMKKDNRFIIINRWLQNAEISTLIRHCHIVVCPYYSSSQTGITQTVFCFSKPIIATRVPAFITSIDNQKTGILVDIGDDKQLANAINQTFTDKSLYDLMCKNIRKLKEHKDDLWKDIVIMYVNEYLK